jgi:Nucleotidyl transferase AbiEii toxin, Type IV TA system
MAATTSQPSERLAIGYALDRLWGETMGLPAGDSKETPLRLIADLLERERVPYALIGGVAVQLYTAEPRSTLDIDLAVPTYRHVPAEALRRAGFEHTGRHEHSDNWRAPGSGPPKLRTAVQFSAEDAGIAEAVEHARMVDLHGGLRLRVATAADLIALKLLAADEPRRRGSKRQHDLADVLALLEEHPDLKSPALVARLQGVRTRLLATDLD